MQAFRIAVVISLTLGALLATPGRPASPPQANAADDALLTEVRSLRVAIERLATNGARTQVLLGRVQLQEARIGEIGRRLQGIRDRATLEEPALAEVVATVKRVNRPYRKAGRIPESSRS